MHLGRALARVALTGSHAASATILSGFGRPFGLAQDLDENLLVTDMDLHAVFRFSDDLTRVTLFGAGERDGTFAVREGTIGRAPACEPRLLNGPHAVAVATDGSLYVTTYYEPAICVFDTEGALVAKIAINGSPIALRGPATAFFDASERLLVSEFSMNAILALTPDGDYLGGLGWSGGRAVRFARVSSFSASSEPGGFNGPHMCRQSPDGFLVVADTWNHRLQRFAPDGSWAGSLGASGTKDGDGRWCHDPGHAAPSAAPGRLHAPVAVGWSDSRQLVVTDWGNNRLQIFDPDVSVPLILDGLGLDRPYDAQFLGNRLCIADSHHGRVLILDAGELPPPPAAGESLSAN